MVWSQLGEAAGNNLDFGGLASSAGDFAGFINPNTLSAITPNISTLPTGALTNVAGTLAEDGAEAGFTGFINPNTLGPINPVANASMVGGGVGYVQPTITGLAGKDSAGSSILDTIKGYGTDTMKFFNDNSKSLEAGGKLIGGLGGLYYQNQMAGLAKQQLNDSRANTAYNRARQATGDANLQSASDRVFGKYNG